jgi:putative transposase
MFIVNGKPIKSINRLYNKNKANMQSKLKAKVYSSKKIIQLTNKRNNRISNYLHKSSKYIIDYCLANNVGTIIIGKNDGWKQDINLGKKTLIQI